MVNPIGLLPISNQLGNEMNAKVDMKKGQFRQLFQSISTHTKGDFTGETKPYELLIDSIASVLNGIIHMKNGTLGEVNEAESAGESAHDGTKEIEFILHHFLENLFKELKPENFINPNVNSVDNGEPKENPSVRLGHKGQFNLEVLTGLLKKIESLSPVQIQAVLPKNKAEELTKLLTQISGIIDEHVKSKMKDLVLQNQRVVNLSGAVDKIMDNEDLFKVIRAIELKGNTPTKSPINLQNFNLNLSEHQQDFGKIKSVIPTFENVQTVGVNHSKDVIEFPLSLNTAKGNDQKTMVDQQEFVKKFLDIMKTSKMYRQVDGKSVMTIRLNPEHLGSLTVRLVQQNNETIAKIMASTQSAKELLEHSIHQLKQALPNTEIAVHRFELVEEQPMSSFREHQEKEHHQNQKNEKKHDDSQESFKDRLEEILNLEA
ncbi:flagellar hook-length control protein FliK [Bacillus kexueae]|uniref:flagellar hook-length control protein FliK n=1 Tax=Aeribacillus kexueae TaxID=2078952 RepID=UPI001FAFC031|nr:flagellar hook-length control protein FliK [Bacillus kexueae]